MWGIIPGNSGSNLDNFYAIKRLEAEVAALKKRCCCTVFNLTEYADDAAAGEGGLTTGMLYQTGGVVMIKQ